IGSPSMNVVEGTLRKVGGTSWVEALGRKWPTSIEGAGTDGMAVHYGVRPSDIVPAAQGEGIEATVIVVEPTGAETELLLDVGGQQMIAVIHGRTAAQAGDAIRLQISPASAHLFASSDGRRL
ncbi:MAG: TOBE domain-containing protein, partial [Ramlibacter sp.]|nr:TOBE domain-containing protein [Ramlibacter sp.]